MNILVTGCAGFIGSHLCEYLVKLGHRVIGIDNFDDFYDKSIKIDNISNLLKHPHFQLYYTDIRHSKELLDIKEEVDMLIHLAAKAGVRPSIKNPKDYIHTNIEGTQNVLEFIKRKKIKKYIFASSSSIYGNNKKIPFKENSLCDNPISPYAFTKKSCEMLNHTYHHIYHTDIINLRFFTVFGPRQRPDLAINKFAELISNNKPIPMYGDGSSFRDYTYISDIVSGISAAVTYLSAKSNVYETINLGNNSPISLKDMISVIAEELGMNYTILELPPQQGDVNKTLADISKAERLLGYKPQVDFREGVKNFIDWAETKKFCNIRKAGAVYKNI